MNLYTPNKRVPNHINSHTIYLATIERENPGVDVDLKLITTIRSEQRTLYVLSSAGKFYLASNFMFGVGMENILYSSAKLSRVISYGEKLIKQ